VHKESPGEDLTMSEDKERSFELDPTSVRSTHQDSPNQNSSQSDTRVPQSVKITEDLTRYFVSDPNYPSYEILLQVAGKLLDSPR
jgi:hypothetical protein